MPSTKKNQTALTLRDYPSDELPGDRVEQLPAAFLGLGEATPSLFQNAVFWFPQGVPNGKSVAVVSSRLGQKLEEKASLFDALRTLACRVDPTQNFLITANGMATDEFVTRISNLFSIPRIRFVQVPPSIDKAWIQNASRQSTKNEFTCYYELPAAAGKRSSQVQAAKDQLLISAAQELRVLACRENGNTMKAIFRRLAGNGDTRVLYKEQLIRKPLLDRFVEHGATAWMLLDRSPPPIAKEVEQIDAPVLTLDEIDANQYLLHYTRRCVGQWPGQSRDDYLDDLIFGSKRASHDPLAALCRILATDRMMATNNLTRDPARVVCFSEVNLNDLPKMKTFRPHLSRWDFLPYGIAIERDLLKSIGTRQVTYGSESDWEKTANQNRPYFQLTGDGLDDVDWRIEKEWRLQGDLILRGVGPTSAVVFVPTMRDAAVIAKLSRWPIVVLS